MLLLATEEQRNSLTDAERLFIWRRRAGMTKLGAAKRLRVSRRVYHGWETNREPRNRPTKKVPDLTLCEFCVLLRRRRGVRTTDLAEEIGVSRTWLAQLERGVADPSRLYSFWGVM